MMGGFYNAVTESSSKKMEGPQVVDDLPAGGMTQDLGGFGNGECGGGGVVHGLSL